MNSHRKPNRFAINKPTEHPRGPPRPIKALYAPAFPSGINSIEKETVDTRNKQYAKPITTIMTTERIKESKEIPLLNEKQCCAQSKRVKRHIFI